MSQVQTTLPLLGAQIDPELRPRLLLATAELTAQAGWMSFVANRHEAARRLGMIGLARNADHPQGTDLTVYLLADMALQAVHLERPKEAVHLAGTRSPPGGRCWCCVRSWITTVPVTPGSGAATRRILPGPMPWPGMPASPSPPA